MMMFNCTRKNVFLVALCLGYNIFSPALAQDVCFTPVGGCYMQQLGPFGGPCYCPAQGGGFFNGVIGSSQNAAFPQQQQLPPQQYQQPQYQPQYQQPQYQQPQYQQPQYQQ